MTTPTLQTIFRRRSIRVFTDQPVPQDHITILLQAAMAAPSARNGKPWEFVVVTEPDKLVDLRTHLTTGSFTAPLVIAVLANPAISDNPNVRKMFPQDCANAMENLMLAATDLGLGSCWVANYPNEDRMATVRRILGVPEEVFPFCCAYVGYPGEEKPPRTQYDEARVHWQAYDPSRHS